MILVNQNNFTMQTMQKQPGADAAPKHIFYANFKVCLALEGEAVWEIGDQIYRIQPGDIVLLNIGQKRRFLSFGEDGFSLCAFVLNRSAFSKPHHFMFFLSCVKNKKNVIQSGALSALLKEAYDEWKTGSPFRYELVSAKLTEFFIKAETLAADPFEPVTENDRQMFQIMDHIDEHIFQRISLRDAAQKAGMSESTFSRHFSRWNGVSFKQYVIEKKIQQAIFLLQTTNMKMIDIALESGFDSVSGFYDAFQKKTGTTPRNFSQYEGNL